MLTSSISLKNFKSKANSKNLKKRLISILKNKNEVIESLGKKYKNSFSKKQLNKYKNS